MLLFASTDGNKTLNTLSTTMTTLMDRVVGGAGVWSQASDLWRIFTIPLALHSTYDDFQEKNLHGYYISIIPCGNCQTFHCSNFTTIESLKISTRDIQEEFFLKIGIS